MPKEEGLQLEYSAIREEIVCLTSSKDQMILMMYSICIAILGLMAFLDAERIVGLMFAVLIPFQAFINSKLFQIARSGAYINVFIEPKINGLKWEQVIHKADNEFNLQYRFNLGNIQFTRKYGASIFAIIAVFVFAFDNICIVENTVKMQIDKSFLMLLYFLLCIFVLYLNKKGVNFEKIYNMYINIFKNQKI